MTLLISLIWTDRYALLTMTRSSRRRDAAAVAAEFGGFTAATRRSEDSRRSHPSAIRAGGLPDRPPGCRRRSTPGYAATRPATAPYPAGYPRLSPGDPYDPYRPIEAARHQRQGDRRAGRRSGRRDVCCGFPVDRRADPRRHRDARDQTHRSGRPRDRARRRDHRRTRPSSAGCSILLLIDRHLRQRL